MTSPPRRPHVMLVAFAAQGHLNPMLQFAGRLAAKGVDVTLASTQDARDRMLSARRDHDQAAASMTAAPRQVNIEIESFSDGYDHGGDVTFDIIRYMNQLGAAGPPNLTELILELGRRGRPITCLVNNPFVPWVLDVGARLGIPCATLWIQSYALYAMYRSHHQDPSRFEENGSHLTIPGLPPIRTEDLPSLVRADNPYQIFTRLLAEQFEKMKANRWVFANSIAELESEIIETVAELQHIKPVGPLVPVTLLGQSKSDSWNVRADMWAAEPDCLGWLDRQADNSVIYISLGSFATVSAEQMAELAWVLKNSKVPFLWVAKPKRGESDVGLPEGFVEETSDQGRVVSWCPQTDVLEHQALAAFLTHCGWNSTLETLSAGVPVIAFPQWTDQPTNAKFLVDVFRVGVRLQVGPNGLVSREEFERCRRELMTGEIAGEMRKNAQRWKSVLRTAAADGGSSDRNIQEFVDELISLDPQPESADPSGQVN
ncbi:putative UDP-glucose glucosyltransferase [Nymphaea colorata]|uniref:putative UDP-glucose glucosyltransferase n=1 Tax=Nymphaea colorata TaxID=210225 RepID=UPI00129ECABC|nr:putative UDP-glucose glucosyltransferase [Nymphaea colorata]